MALQKIHDLIQDDSGQCRSVNHLSKLVHSVILRRPTLAGRRRIFSNEPAGSHAREAPSFGDPLVAVVDAGSRGSINTEFLSETLRMDAKDKEILHGSLRRLERAAKENRQDAEDKVERGVREL